MENNNSASPNDPQQNQFDPQAQGNQQTPYSAPQNNPAPPYNMPPQKVKKPIYKKWWFWLIIVIVAFIIIGSAAGGDSETDNPSDTTVSVSGETSTISESTTQKETEPDVPAEYKSALIKAQSYSDIMHMSKQGIYDQLTSEYGEKFSDEAAQYAIDHVKADWKENALKKAKSYQETMAMSSDAIHDQLTSEYGEKFTQEEADYAIENLNK